MAKKMATKVLFCLVVIVILMSTMPVISSNSASGTFEIFMDYGEIHLEHKYLDCGENVNYFDISVKYTWEDPAGIEKLRIDAATGESFESNLFRVDLGDVFILDAKCGKITLTFVDFRWDSDGWYDKFSYLIEESDSEPSHSINVWTDKSEYKIGEPVKIYYKTNKKCTAKLTVTKPDGEKIVYGPNEIPACTRSKSATAGYPTGKRTVVFEAGTGGKSKKATCYFDVVEEKKPTPPPTPPPQKPDLKITDLSWSHDSPTSLDIVTYTVEIKNIGTATAEKFWIKILFDDDVEDIDIVESLDPGNSYSQKFYIRKNCGSYGIKAIVDPHDFIKEINDNNNIMEKHISIDCGDSIERALIIGITNCKEPLWPPALFATNDAKGVYNLLRWGYGYDPANIILLLDCDATKNNIEYYVNEISEKTDGNDKFIFYFSGHSVKSPSKEETFLPYDKKTVSGGTVNVIVDLEKLFGNKELDGDFLAIFDTCFCGGFCKETDADGDPSGIDGNKRVVLMSTANEYNQQLTNAFTLHLIDAFASHSKDADLNGDLRVSAEEAFKYSKGQGIWRKLLDNPQIMDHYLDESNREAELHISNELVVDEIITGEGGSSVHIHAYDTEGKHVGTADSGNIVSEIPGAWYSGPASHPEEIIIFGISEDITFTIEGQIDETFNFTVRQFTEVNDIIVNYDDVPIKENAVATVAVSKANPAYTMEIDNNGDGTTDYTKEPDSIETITEQKVEEIGGTPSGEVTGIKLWVLYNGVWTKDPAAIDYGEWTYMLLYLDQGQRILMEDTYPSGYVTTKDLGYLSPGYHYYRWIADAVGWHKIVADGSITGQSNEISVYVWPI